MKKGDHKGLGGNSRRSERKRNRYASSLERRDRVISKRIAACDDAAKIRSLTDNERAILALDREALVVRLRRVERLAKGCSGKPASALSALRSAAALRADGEGNE